MGLFKYLKKKFSKQNIDSQRIMSTEIANIDDFISLPKKSDLSKASRKELRSYKNEYRKIIASTKNLQSTDLNIGNFRDLMKMYTDLLSNLVVDTENGVSKTKILEGCYSKETDAIVRKLKLEIYLSNISTLKEEIMLRLMALKEIILESVLTSKLKQNSIRSEVNNLESNYLSITNQEIVSYLMANNYKNTYLNGLSKETVDEESLKIRKDMLREFAKQVIPDVLEVLDSKNSSLEIEIAILECELEKYVYKNIRILENLDKQAKYEAGEWDRNKRILPKFYMPILELESVEKMECLYKIFFLYGRNLVKEESLLSLYGYKLDLLISSYECREMGHLKLDGFEAYYMARILEQKVIDLGMGKYDAFYRQFGLYAMNAVEIVRNMCRNEEKKLDFTHVLEDYDLVKLIMSLDKENGIVEYFGDVKSKISGEFSNFYGRGFTWEKEIPLSSKLTMEYYGRIGGKYNLNQLFNYLKENEDYGDYYYLPEGISEIRSDHEDIELSLAIENIRKKCVNKIVVMPSSLKVLTGELFSDIPIKKVILNDGLKTLNLNTLKGAEGIVIPNTIEHIVNSPLENDCSIRVIEFKDYENSKILNDVVLWGEFLENIIRELESSDIGRPGVIHYDYAIMALKNVTYLDKLCFSSDNQEIVIKKSDMQNIRCFYYRYVDYLGEYHYLSVWEDIKTDYWDYTLKDLKKIINIKRQNNIKRELMEKEDREKRLK